MDNNISVDKLLSTFDQSFRPLMLIKCTLRRYAESFQKGKLFFNTPKAWIDIGETGNIGQGDNLEGVFKCSRDIDDCLNQTIIDKSIEKFNYKGNTYYRRKAMMDYRCLCLYGIHNKSFKKSFGEDRRAQYSLSITKEYFSDFTDIKAETELENVCYDDRPVVVFINDPGIFFERIITKLESLGINRDSIIISPIKYINMEDSFEVEEIVPMELLYKDIKFSNQSEVRIIINDASDDFKTYIVDNKGIIDVGSLEDITTIQNYYFRDLEFENFGNSSLMYSLPNPVSKKIEDLDFVELINLIFNVLHERVKLEGLSSDDLSWNEKLKTITDLLESKYGVCVLVDDNKNISLMNVSDKLKQQLDMVFKNEMDCDNFNKMIDSFFEKKEYEKALALCDRQIQDSNIKFIKGCSFYNKGRILFELGKIEEAVDCFSQAIKMDYKEFESLDFIASYLYDIHKYEDALILYNRLLEIKGYSSEICGNIGLCLFQLCRYEEALVWFDKGIECDENDSFSYYNKGITLYKMRKYMASKTYMNKAIELSPDNEFYISEYNKAFSK